VIYWQRSVRFVVLQCFPIALAYNTGILSVSFTVIADEFSAIVSIRLLVWTPVVPTVAFFIIKMLLVAMLSSDVATGGSISVAILFWVR